MKHLRRKKKTQTRSGSSFPHACSDRLTVEALESRVLLSVVDFLRITEINYHPAEPSSAELLVDPSLVEDDFEFIELQNIGSQTLDLTGVRFVEVAPDPLNPFDTEGFIFNFTGSNVTSLAPGEFVLVVEDIDAFEVRYGTGLSSQIAGQYTGGISNGGERITLKYGPGADDIIQQFDYNDNWFPVTDGINADDPLDPDDPFRFEVFSLTIINASDPDPDVWDDKDGWRPSSSLNGTPGQGDTFFRQVVINEFLAHADVPSGDWIELYNVSGAPLDIGGWFISDDNTELNKYEIAANTIIPAGGYIVFTQANHFGNISDSGAHNTFGFSENGESAYLSSAQNGALTGYFEERDFGASQSEVTFGRYEKSTGTYNFVAMSEQTPGLANADPLVGPVVISEIMYNPLAPTPGELAVDPSLNNDDFEYVRLTNITGLPVNMREFIADINGDAYVGWQFTRGIDFTFSNTEDTIIPAFSSLIIAGNPVAFDLRHGSMPPDVPVLGPFANDTNLRNNGERVDISRPGGLFDEDTNNPSNPLERMYIRVERVNYNDIAPWPTEPDGPNGDGSALVRIENSEYGNDPINWQAGQPLNFPPTIASLIDAPDPVSQGNNLTLIADNVSDFNDSVNLVEFYWDDGNGTFEASTDLLLGSDISAAGGWSWTGSVTFDIGSHTFFARARDTYNTWSIVVQTTGNVVGPNELPEIDTLTANPDPVTQGDNLTLTANGVDDIDGSVALVEFYHDADDNGTWESGVDTLLGTDTDDTDGWSWTGSTASFDFGANNFFARAQDNDNAWGDIALVSAEVADPNPHPVIGLLTSAPDPIPQGDDLTLTANNVTDSNGSVTQVQFYRDFDGDQDLNVSIDSLLGTDANGADGWSWTGSSATFDLGVNYYFARAQDNEGAWSDSAAHTTATVEVPNQLATIGSLTGNPDPVAQGINLTLSADNVTDSDGMVSLVEFYRDANGNSAFDAGIDTLLGTDTDGADGWSWVGSTGSFAIGINHFFARAQDNEGDFGASVVAEVNVKTFFVTAGSQTVKTVKTVKYVDSNYTEVTVNVANGTANLYFVGDDLGKEFNGKTVKVVGGTATLQNVDFWYSDVKTSLTISAKGSEKIILGGLSGQYLSKLNGKMVEVTGDINLTSALGSMTVDTIDDGVSVTAQASIKGFSLKAKEIGTDVNFDISGLVKSFQTNTFIGGEVTADVITKVIVKSGDLGADLTSTVGEIGTVTSYGQINSDIDSATFIKKITSKTGGIGADAFIIARAGDIGGISTAQEIAGRISADNTIKKISIKAGDFTGAARAGSEIGSLKALNLDHAILSAANTIKKVYLKGNILDSYILGGYDIGPDCQFGLQEPGGGDFLNPGNVISVTAKGEFARSFIAAGTLPSSVETDFLPSVGVPAGFGSIGKVKFTSIDPTPAFDYGLFAVTEIKPFKIGKDPAVPDGHFRIDLVT